MQSPWTRDGKVRAEQVTITPQVSGRIVELNIKDNQLVKAGDILFTIDKTPLPDRRAECPGTTGKSAI